MAFAAPTVDIHRFAVADCDDVAFGPEGDLYFACHSPGDKLTGKVQGAKAEPDVMDGYVLRVRPQTGEIVFATRIGGSSFDAAFRIAVDRSGYAYTTGLTKSKDFPVTSGGTQSKLRGPSDAFLTKLSPTGAIVSSILVGGSGDELGNGLAIGEDGTVYLGGVTSSADFATRAAAKASHDADAFVCRIQLRSTACMAFGGSKNEKLTGIALDGKGGIYAVGGTNSADFPRRRSLQKTLRGPGDLFVTRLALPSLKITFSTLFGGSGDDSGWGIAVDRRGNAVVAGITDSQDLPATPAAYQPKNKGKKDAFLAILGADQRNIRATYFGGSSDDESGYDGNAIQVDRDGNIWIAGITYSSDLSTRNALQSHYGGGNGDGFVAMLDSELKRLCFAGYFGDNGRNLLEGVAVSPAGLVAATGVSFRESPSAFHIRIGNENVYAGHNVFLLSGPTCRP